MHLLSEQSPVQQEQDRKRKIYCERVKTGLPMQIPSSFHMPVKQRAVGCQASQTLSLCHSNTAPQETEEVPKPARMKTVPKHIQKRYNLNREEVHGYASLSFLAEILKAHSPSSLSLQTFSITYTSFAKVQ
jgi:hypothetical protein